MKTHTRQFDAVKDFLVDGIDYTVEDEIIVFPIENLTPFIQANSYFFGHPEWAKKYLQFCHRDAEFQDRWQAALGGWDDKIVVDIGCGPGNLYASIGGQPRLLIGVDVSRGALAVATKLGYQGILADAHNLPLISEFADVVTLNAALHHCDDMHRVLAEAARLVKPGGLLIIDHDPQLSAWNYKGLGMIVYRFRLLIYKLIIRQLHIPEEERSWMLATEAHHKPGDGVTSELFYQGLEPLGFTVNLYPHNQRVGAEVFQGERGKFPHWRYPLGQWLSGIKSDSPEAALSIMCVARRA